MTKKRSKVGLIIFSIVLALGLVLTFCPFYMSFNYKTFNGFFNAIPVGTDIAGGTYSVYKCSENKYNSTIDLDKEIDKTISSLQATLNKMGYISSSVIKENNDEIRVEVGEHKDLAEISSEISAYKAIYLTSKAESDFDVENPTGNFISAKNIKSITNHYAGGGTFGININFDSEGAKLYNQITKDAVAEDGTKKINVILVDSEGAVSNPISLDCTEESEEDSFGFTSTSFTSQNSADMYVLQLLSSTYNLELELIEYAKITPSLGENAGLFLAIACFVALAIAILVMIYRYNHLGLMGMLSMLAFLVLDLFLLQTISSVIFTMGSVFALVLVFFLMFEGQVVIFEKFREEYKTGMKIPLAMRGAFKKATWHIVDTNVIVAAMGIALTFFGSSVLRSIGFILLVGSLLGMFINLVVSKLLCMWYVNINPTKHKYYNLKKIKREEDVVIENPEQKGEN